MANRIQLRRGTAAQWTAANPVLAQGEPGIETDTGKQKFGNGVAVWSALPYASVGPEGPPGTADDASVADLVTTPGSETATALSATYALKAAMPPVSVFGALLHRSNGILAIGAGDSITSFGAGERSHFEQLAARSRQRIARLRNAGVPQDTVQMLRARYEADVLAHYPDVVLFKIGVNNNGRGEADTIEAKAKYREMLDLNLARGIASVMYCITPRSDVTTTASKQFILDWNIWVRAEAASRGLPVVDAYADLATADNLIKPEYTTDNLHLTAAGAAVIAKKAWQVLAPYYQGKIPVYSTESATDPTNLFANGTFTDMSPADGLADGFTYTNAPSRYTATIGTDPAIVGNYVRLTRLEAATGSASVSRSIVAAQTAGHVFEMSVKFRPHVGHSLAYNIYANVADAGNVMITQPYPINQWTIHNDGEWMTAYNRFVIPANTGRIQMYCSTASGLGSIDFAQFTMRNRTLLGLP